jgi:hypothetical protein
MLIHKKDHAAAAINHRTEASVMDMQVQIISKDHNDFSLIFLGFSS